MVKARLAELVIWPQMFVFGVNPTRFAKASKANLIQLPDHSNSHTLNAAVPLAEVTTNQHHLLRHEPRQRVCLATKGPSLNLTLVCLTCLHSFVSLQRSATKWTSDAWRSAPSTPHVCFFPLRSETWFFCDCVPQHECWLNQRLYYISLIVDIVIIIIIIIIAIITLVNHSMIFFPIITSSF